MGAFCNSVEKVEKGDAKVVQCLLNHVHDEGMDTPCRDALIAESKKRAMDYDFNINLKKACDAVLQKLDHAGMCDNSKENWQTICLTNNLPNINGSMPEQVACKRQVRIVLRQQSADLRARPGMEMACKADLERLCDGVEAGASRWHQCLRNQAKQISNPLCKAMVAQFDKVAGTRASIDFSVRTKCANEMKTFCKDVPPGDSRMMVCLNVNVDLPGKREGFTQACKSALAGKANHRDIANKILNFTKHKDGGLDAVKDLFKKHASFTTDKVGALLFLGTVCFVAVLSCACSYCILQRRFNKVMYTVDTVERPENV